jgi:HNH endonuclease
LKYSVDIDHLATLYDSGLTCRKIEEVTGVPHRTVFRYLKSAGRTLRNPGTPVIAILEDREWLVAEYSVKMKSTTQIAEEAGCSSKIVSLWLSRHGIEARGTGSTPGHQRNSSLECRQAVSLKRRGKYVGEDNPNWHGGIQLRDPDRGRYPYKVWTKSVKDRDGWKCTKCGETDRLHSHHIKSWRYHPELRYDVQNGVTLCHECHEKEHGRGWKFRWPSKPNDPRAHRPEQGMI